MDDDQKKDEKKALPISGEPAKQTMTPSSVLPPELAEALRAGTINVNNLLIQISNKTQDPHEFLRETRELLEIAKAFDAQRLEHFKSQGNAIIDLKTRDPDEVEKRRNNRTRRFLKYLVGGGALGCIGSGVVGLTVVSMPLAIAAILLGTGAVCLPLTAVLASGESVSTSDVVSIFRAVTGLADRSRVTIRSGQPEGQRKKGGRR